MEFWLQLGLTFLLLAATFIPLFLLLHYFGILIVKGGTYFGSAAGTPSKFWGNYRHLSGYVSKSFRIPGKYSKLSLQVDPVSGSADVEVLDRCGNVLQSWKADRRFEREINCRDLKRCKVRITSRDFEGKFLVALQ